MMTGIRHIATEPSILSMERLSGLSRSMHRKKNTTIVNNKIGTTSDSDNSAESSPSTIESSNDQIVSVQQTPNKLGSHKRLTRRGSEWEILEGLKNGQRFDDCPERYAGYLHKKRKWPLKGWHKRYFVVDKGILIYGKNPTDISRGKIHGQIDIGLSVISTKRKRRRIDIDADEFIYHIKAKSLETFTEWIQQMKRHRLYRQHIITFGSTREIHSRPLNVVAAPKNLNVLSAPETTCVHWDDTSNNSLEQAIQEISNVEHQLLKLSSILDKLDAIAIDSDVNLSPGLKKDKRKWLRKKKSNSSSSGNWSQLAKTSSGDSQFSAMNTSSSLFKSHSTTSAASRGEGDEAHYLSHPAGLSVFQGANTLSNSNPALNSIITVSRNLNVPSYNYLPERCAADISTSAPDFKHHSDFISVAKETVGGLKKILSAITVESDRLKTASEANGSSNALQSMVTAMQYRIAQFATQNDELRSRLRSIHLESDIDVLPRISNDEVARTFSTSCLSTNDVFFDAEEFHSEIHEQPEPEYGTAATSDSSSEIASISSDEGSVSSETSDLVTITNHFTPSPATTANSINEVDGSKFTSGATKNEHRLTLPCPRPNTEGLSVWNLLKKNIGKDLSQVSMPVALNEPLSMLQRLCEELEYSELLDKAAQIEDECERMVYVAAFAVSGYASSYHRAGSKPFNPLLGETFDFAPSDKGFRFIAEQVSHHPPISVCHAESKSFVFWQDVRIKTKFWGKSMEFQPIGYVNVKIFRPEGEYHYRWNKVTTCIHNLFSGQRWADQYGELIVTSVGRSITCKLTFAKASYWSTIRHEVHGGVYDHSGNLTCKLFGKWNEALYSGSPQSAICVWRAGIMPENYEKYYGFTKLAIALNEKPDENECLPPTDTRFRPDQRLLEEGKLDEAESLKLSLEQSQRERRQALEQSGTQYSPQWFKKSMSTSGEETWEYTNKYWDVKKKCGFASIQFQKLW